MEEVSLGKKKRKIRFADDETVTISRAASTTSILSSQSGKNRGLLQRGSLRNKSTLDRKPNLFKNDSNKLNWHKKKNPMFSSKPPSQHNLKPVLNFRSKPFGPNDETRQELARHALRKKRFLKQAVSFYPVSQTYIYLGDHNSWLKYGQESNFSEYVQKFIPLNLSLKDFAEKFAMDVRFDEEIGAREISEEIASTQTQITEEDLENSFNDLLKQVYSSVADEAFCVELVNELVTELSNMFDIASRKKIAEDKKVCHSDDFQLALRSYLRVSFINKAIETNIITKLFTHKYTHLFQTEACKSISQLLEVITDSNGFEKYPVENDVLIAFKRTTLLFMQQKFYCKVDKRKAKGIYQEESSQSRAKFDLSYREYSFVDILTQDVIDADTFYYKYPKYQLNTAWSQVDLKSFLRNPQKAWLYEKSKWGLSILKLLNCGLASSLINDYVELRDFLLDYRISHVVAAQINHVQKAVTNYVRVQERELELYRSESVISSQSEDYPEKMEYFFDPHKEIDMNDCYAFFHRVLDSSSKNYVIEQITGLDNIIDGYKSASHRNTTYAKFIDTNAYSLHVNPVIRADLHYSRRRSGCYTTSTGHCGKLLITLIHLRQENSIAFVLDYGLKANLKVSSTIAKELRWEDGVFYSSQRQLLVDQAEIIQGRSTPMIEDRRKWVRMYKDVWKVGMSLFKSNGEVRITDISGFNDDEALSLKTRYEKVSPLAVALSQFGYETLHNWETSTMRSIVQMLLDKGAKLTNNENDAIRALLPYLRSSMLKSHGLRVIEKKKDSVLQPNVVTGRNRPTKKFLMQSIMISVGISKTRAKRKSFAERMSFASTEDFSKLRNIQRKMTNISMADDFIGGILDVGANELNFKKFTYGSSMFELKWNIIIRVSILYECVLSKDFTTFRLLAPFSMKQEDMATRKSSTVGGTVNNDTHKINPVTAECIYSLVDMLCYNLLKSTSNFFALYLEGLTFILEEYVFIPTKWQLETVLAAILSNIQKWVLHSTESSINAFLSSHPVRYALYNTGKGLFFDRHISSFTLYPHARRKLKLRNTRKWRSSVKKTRRKLMKVALGLQMFDTFSLLFQQDGPSSFNGDELLNIYYNSVLITRNASHFTEILEIMDGLYRTPSSRVAMFLYSKCLQDDRAHPLISVMLDIDEFPSIEQCQTLIIDILIENPLTSRMESYDRAVDLTSVRVFYKLRDFLIKSPTTDEEYASDLAMHINWLKEILNHISELSLGDRELIWYEGLQELSKVLTKYFVKASSGRRGDNGQVLDTQLAEIGHVIRMGNPQKMVYDTEKDQLTMIVNTHGRLNKSSNNSSLGGLSLLSFGST